MKAETLRRFTSVHTWVGLVAGIGLFIAFYAGAVSVFVHELQGWEEATEGVAIDPPARTQQLLDTMLQTHPEAAHDLYMALPGDHGPRASIHWYEEATGKSHVFRLGDDGKLDAGKGHGATQYVYDLHFTAGLPRAYGAYLFGVFCILYGIALVSGVILYAPVFIKDLFALRVGKNLKRMWQDAHNVVGLLSLPFHVIFAWSGAVLAIGYLMLAPFQFLVFENKLLDIVEPDITPAPHIEPANVRATPLKVAELLRRAEVIYPGLEAEGLSLHESDDVNGTATVMGHIEDRVLSQHGAVVMNIASGEQIRVVSPEQRSLGANFLAGLTSLHYGQFGGMTVKWLYFVLGLAGAFLFYSGNLLWIESRRRRRKGHAEQPRRTRFMAALTLGTCLGCVAGVSAVFVVSVLASPALVPTTYVAVFFACTLWAFLRRPAHAGHELLWLCALLTAAIPVAGFIASGEHLFAAMARGHWQRAGIDLTALAGAAVFARLAIATLRRGRNDDPNSVWALPSSQLASQG